ncbi:hypothetical protein DFQ01_10888 [Paenibacillus cellulosilyticus]|uniref:Uncharacterized protein n=1 Tax=Paenibacillus cellulosilyticus TaxID=375489 RepID=A0A2V2Z2E2_9BACL|nr:CBO0543 family protein [Paenibacillus cellulosilyticus]PWW02811.1 hypothetical protein DFQ01_10888 [Paenibacillus cellulosilyticus]QKS45733.1 hypothetical protein HUB94_15770 [Paenibacillus cellulosilyticus]
MSYHNPTFDEIKKVDHELSELRKQYFYHHDLFSFQWWLLLVIAVIPWIIWCRLVDKSKLREILLFGSIISIIVVLLDDTGGELGLWSYPYQLIRLMPRLHPVDFAVLPVCHMLIYQYFRSWKSFVIANVMMSAVFSFVAEPLLVWLHIYDLDKWKYIYSFPVYIAKALLVKWIVEMIIRKSKQSA